MLKCIQRSDSFNLTYQNNFYCSKPAFHSKTLKLKSLRPCFSIRHSLSKVFNLPPNKEYSFTSQTFTQITSPYSFLEEFLFDCSDPSQMLAWFQSLACVSQAELCCYNHPYATILYFLSPSQTKFLGSIDFSLLIFS